MAAPEPISIVESGAVEPAIAREAERSHAQGPAHDSIGHIYLELATERFTGKVSGAGR
jgi:hypothetical protein